MYDAVRPLAVLAPIALLACGGGASSTGTINPWAAPGPGGPERHQATGGLGAPDAGAAATPDLGYLAAPIAQTFHVSPLGNDAHPGSADQPWRTVSKAVASLQAGQAAVIHAGTYTDHLKIDARDGIPLAPIRLMGAPGEPPPVIRAARSEALVLITRRHWILEGLVLDAGGQQSFGVRMEGARHVTLRNCEIKNGVGPAAVSIIKGATDIHLMANRVHHYRYTLGGQRADSHAFFVGPDVKRVLLRENEAFENSGDGFQCQGPREAGSGQNPPEDLLLEDNRFHDNDENAVDIKSCKRVTVRSGPKGQSELYGHGDRNLGSADGPCGGAAIVIHYDATQVLIENNRLWDNGAGISIGRADAQARNIVIRRNLFTNLTQSRNGCGDGVIIGKSRNVAIFNNTFEGLPAAAVRLASGPDSPVQDLQIWNNIVSSVGLAFDLQVGNTKGLSSDRNLFWNGENPILFSLDGAWKDLPAWQQEGADGSSAVGDPHFGPEHLPGMGSAARDQAINIDDPWYCDGGPDLGYAESCQ
jgi:hypothetical protein